jgi:hypothetical protein
MFICECGGQLLVIAVEDYPAHLTSKEKLTYKRVCDVKCSKCGKITYSQSYDGGSTINTVKTTKPI